MKNNVPLISLHGGHSGDFCQHATNSLEEILQAYVDKGYAIVGITEHMPPPDNRFRYPDETAAGIDAEIMRLRFDRYFETARRLQKELLHIMKVWVGFETEWYDGALPLIRELIARHNPDYIIGSLHHVGGIAFDYDEEHYMRATQTSGGLDALYQHYFDQQFEMIKSLSPAVVGHFDIIRIHDPNYRERMVKSTVKPLIFRNLELIKERGLILDLNTRAMIKGDDEFYPSRMIIDQAHLLGIPLVPGDDSHSVPTVGYKIEQAIRLLQTSGLSTDWEQLTKNLTTTS